ncbi:MAG: polysaccharide deacetylase family protein [Roseiarcus sp.]|jgi:peptidoglycan/xylan/chitin deacetylase (PgdA/CDA1 family)
MIRHSAAIARALAGALMATIALLGAARAEDPGVPILLYHRFHPTEPGSTTVTTPAFEEQLAWLAEHHYAVVRLGSVVDALRGGRELEPQSVAITVDDGRRSQYTEMFPIIQRYHVPVTLFVYTDAISVEPDALTWEEIGEMLKSGLVDVQSHTCSHPFFEKERARRSAADYEAFVATELTKSKKTLEDRLRRPVDLLAWPYGVFDSALERAAARAGYVAAFSVEDRLARAGEDLFSLPRVTVSDRDRGARFAALLEPGARIDPIDPKELSVSCGPRAGDAEIR